jgi:hypothetical protein
MMKTNAKRKNSAVKKLIPAAGMLALSASMLATSTYAWFSMNKTVTATGISMTATVPNQLLIKGSASGAAYKAAIDFTAAADSAVNASAALSNLVPVAYKTQTADTSNPNNTFKKLTTAGMTKVDQLGRVSGTVVDLSSATDVAAATANTDYFYDTFTLKYAGQLDSSVSQPRVKITFEDSDTTNTQSPIVGALHVVLVDNESTPNVYEFDMGSATWTTTGDDANKYVYAPTNVTLFNADNDEVVYTVYVFYDGEDAQCMNANALNMDTYTFTFDFDLVPST